MRAAVIGSPIAHSRSPQIHQAAYQWLDLDWEFDRVEVDASGVRHFVEGLDLSWRGLAVTMPCKQAILGLGVADPIAEALGVGNTVVFDGVPGDTDTTMIYNTDVLGVQYLLAEMDTASQILVFGNGATSRSIVYALSRLGVNQVQIRARHQIKTIELAQDALKWGIEVIDKHQDPDVIVSTVPAHVAAEWASGLTPHLVMDIVYDPWPTPLVEDATDRGAQVITGLDLLAAQAVEQVELMTGYRVDFSILRQAVSRPHDPSVPRQKFGAIEDGVRWVGSQGGEQP